jgi:cobalt-zinc-cadmium efflux system outer membrane protein
MKKIVYLFFTLLVSVQVTGRDEARLVSTTTTPTIISIYETIDFARYLNLVGQNNLGFIAEKLEVNIADALARAERVFPDPELTATLYDNDAGSVLFGRGLELELGYDLEISGQRRSRIRLAKSEAEMARILLDATLADLRAEAAVAFLESQKQIRMLELMQESYEAMRQIHQHDSLRFKFGEISEVEFLQTRLETALLRNQVFEQEAEVKSSMAALNEMAGRDPLSLLMPSTPLSKPASKNYVLGDLLVYALDDHVDLAVVMQEKQITRDELRLVRAERGLELGLNLAYEMREGNGDWMGFNSVAVGVTIPLRFSNLNKGNLRAAQFAVDQAEIGYRAMELEVKRDISQAFFAYEGLQRQVAQFETGMLDDARRIFEGELFRYQNGETALLDVLIARRTYNEVAEEYIDALFEYASSVVELNRTSGMWEVEF